MGYLVVRKGEAWRSTEVKRRWSIDAETVIRRRGDHGCVVGAHGARGHMDPATSASAKCDHRVSQHSICSNSTRNADAPSPDELGCGGHLCNEHLYDRPLEGARYLRARNRGVCIYE